MARMGERIDDDFYKSVTRREMATRCSVRNLVFISVIRALTSAFDECKFWKVCPD
jgi:hypothetical protein